MSVNCTSTYKDCSECNAAQCTKCNDGYTLNPNNNECCASVVQNAIGCQTYDSVCSNECAVCAFGYFKAFDQCLALPC